MATRKMALNYRRGEADRRCENCNHWRPPVGITTTTGGKPVAAKPRCKIIGVKNGKRYWIDGGFVCDGFKGTAFQERILNEKKHGKRVL